MQYARLVLGFVTLMSLFMYGVGVGLYKWFPFDHMQDVKQALFGKTVDATFSKAGKRSDVLEFIAGKKVIECPTASERLGVLVAFGQSNAANSAGYKVKPEEVPDVINFHDGKCWRASSPLLGATSYYGEWISLTGQSLVDAGLYDNVVVMSRGVGGSPVAAWTEGSALNQLFISNLQLLLQKFSVTEMIWHNGESDLKWGVGANQYFQSLANIVSSVRKTGVKAPIFMSVASFCNGGTYPNSITNAQTLAAEKLEGVILGVNTDILVPSDLRNDDKCHFGEEGQRIVASAMAKIITDFHRKIRQSVKTDVPQE